MITVYSSLTRRTSYLSAAIQTSIVGTDDDKVGDIPRSSHTLFGFHRDHGYIKYRWTLLAEVILLKPTRVSTIVRPPLALGDLELDGRSDTRHLACDN